MNESVESRGVTFTGLLTIVFVVLKLIGKITWSWWWVLSPIWITASFIVLLLAVGLAVIWFTDGPGKHDRERRRARAAALKADYPPRTRKKVER